jgi:hypothetical protein
MSNEAEIRSSMTINHTNLDYRSYPTSFKADVTGELGPTPGAFTATVQGTDVSLAELTVPGFCEIANLDDTNFVEVGIYDDGGFHPLMEVGPGERYVIKLSRNVGEQFGTGTGTTDTGTTLRIKADTASCAVFVGAFER